MKKNRKDYYSDLDQVNNPISPEIKKEIVPSNLKIPKERYDGLTDPMIISHASRPPYISTA